MEYDPELDLIFDDIIKYNGTVLDMGCGVGRNSEIFLKKNINIICCDINIKELKQLFLATWKYHEKIQIRYNDIRTYFRYFTKEKYNLIILSQVLNFFTYDEVKRICNECKRHTEYNGYNYIKVYSQSNKKNFLSSLELKDMNNIYNDWENISNNKFILNDEYGYTIIYKNN